jgi:signal transduction histidine kinase
VEPKEAPYSPIHITERLLAQQAAIVRKREDASWPGAEESRRLLETMAESLALLRRSERVRSEMQALTGPVPELGAAPRDGTGDAEALHPPGGRGASTHAPSCAQAIQQERERIARELHDTVGQQLCALRLTLADAQQSRQPGLLRKRLAQLETLVAVADLELDRAVFALHPPTLGGQGLAEAVRQHVAHWSGLYGVPVDLLLNGLEARRLPSAVTAAAYRIVQECLTNIAKHARASRVGVALSARRGELQLSVEDDGTGFDPDSTRGGRLGLVGMRERVAALRGRFAVESAPGQGTTVLVTLPLQPQPQPQTTEQEVAPLGG